MAWKETKVMEERYRMIERWRESGEGITDLASRFEVSRKTIYKWLERYEAGGMEALADQSRAPLVQAAKTPADIERWIVDLRHTHPTWGPRKLRQFLMRRQQHKPWPAESTIALILHRHGLTEQRKKRRRATPSELPLAEARAANDVWSIDFKGWFHCANGERCDPLTISDAASRYLLCCTAVPETTGAEVRAQMEPLFRRHGLPARIRSDNGAPFASAGLGGLTRLSVWWIKLGIVPERIEPGEPQQNGRHERMHRTLKRETASPAAATMDEQQARFDRFRDVYNTERPHEALAGDCPSDRFETSPRAYPDRMGEVNYPAGMALRRADESGKIRWKQARCRVGQALAHEVVGIEPVDDGVSRIWFGPVMLGLLDERRGHSQTATKRSSQWKPIHK
jgi:transposase InsO family protein